MQFGLKRLYGVIMSQTSERSEKFRKSSHAARIAAVQALYQMEVSDRGADGVVKEFLDHRLNITSDDDEIVSVNTKLFEEIVRVTYEKHLQIDDFIIKSLPPSWTIERLDAVLRAILRAGCGEFLMDKNLAAAIIIDEYVNVTKDFFAAKEPGFVNGILDHVAHALDLKIKDEPKAPINDFSREQDTSDAISWEDEGGSNVR